MEQLQIKVFFRVGTVWFAWQLRSPRSLIVSDETTPVNLGLVCLDGATQQI